MLVGFTAAAVTNRLPSTMKRFFTSWHRPHGFTTDVRGSVPIRAVPMRCQPATRSGASATVAEAPLPFAGWHLMGTARMGTDPETSVVNEWGRAHDVKNLFIVDGSIFVTAAAVNPTNTIQALALHIADSIKRNLSTLFD